MIKTILVLDYRVAISGVEAKRLAKITAIFRERATRSYEGPSELVDQWVNRANLKAADPQLLCGFPVDRQLVRKAIRLMPKSRTTRVDILEKSIAVRLKRGTAVAIVMGMVKPVVGNEPFAKGRRIK